MNILLINHYAGNKAQGMEFRPWYLAKEWTKLGHKVTIVAGSYSHLRILQPQVDTVYQIREVEGVKYIYLKTPVYKGNGYKRILNILIFIFRLFVFRNRIYREIKPDVVIASSTYPLDIYPARCIAKKAKAKLVFEVHDLWPLSPIELGGFSKLHPFILLLQMAENFAYKNSDHVVSLLPNTRSHMLEHGLQPEKFIYIPNGIDPDEWSTDGKLPEEHDRLLMKLKSDNKTIVGYVGSHGLANSLNSLIESAKEIENKNIAFVLVGNGPDKDSIIQKANNLCLSNVYFLNPVQKSVIPLLLSRLDILYLGWSKNKLYRFGISPNKLFDYMMAGKPIIHSVDAANDAVKEASCGISVRPEDPKAIAQAIHRLTNLNRVEIVKMGINARNYVIENHNYKILSNKFLASLK